MQVKKKVGLGIIMFLVVIIIVQAAITNIVTYSPPGLSSTNWTNATNNTIPFTFKYVGNETQVNCTLYIDQTKYGTNRTVQNDTNVTFYANNTISQGAHTWNITCDDGHENKSSIQREINIDREDPSVLLIQQPNGTTSLDKNIFNFTYNVTDNYAVTLICTLYLSPIEYFFGSLIGPNLNETDASVPEGAISNFTNKLLDDDEYTWRITCADEAGNEENSEIRTLTVDVAPNKPIIGILPTVTNEARLSVVGYVNRAQSNVTVYATQQGNTRYNSTITLETSTLNETVEVGAPGENSSYFYLNRSAYSNDEIATSSYLEFGGHNRTNYLRYDVIGINFADANYFRVNISPNLESNITRGETIRVYNSTKPTGWFNNTVSLMSGNNSITVLASRLGTNGEPSDIYTVYYDNLVPTINLTLVTNYSTNNPSINFTITDDYALNISTIVANLSATLYRYENLTCSETASVLTCSISETISNGYYNLSVTAKDLFDQTNTSETKTILVNGQAPTITLDKPINNYLEELTNNQTFNFTVNDLFDNNTINCSLYLNDAINQTNQTTHNGTETIFSVSNLEDGSYNWYVKCENNVGRTNQTETRTLIVKNTPDKPVFKTTPVVTRDNTLDIIGYVNKSDTILNITVTQGNWFPNATTRTTNVSSRYLGQGVVGKQSLTAGTTQIYVNRQYNSIITNGSWIEFANHHSENFERYNITSKQVYDQTYLLVRITPALNSNVSQGEAFKVYNSSLPSGWFNITINNMLFRGNNNITIFGTRWDLTGL